VKRFSDKNCGKNKELEQERDSEIAHSALEHSYSLIAFSIPITDEQRTDRVVAEVWDTSYVLFDGIPNARDITRLKQQVPLQEAGRFTQSELVLCRANRSVRFFDMVVDQLASGNQPNKQQILKTGYLLRTTAVYGNGKFGIADRDIIAAREYLASPFCAEMLTVWLIRGFSHDLVEHIAYERAPEKAVKLDRSIKAAIGVGNSTGLGMAPFIINHPLLLNNWILAREKALALFKTQTYFKPTQQAHLMPLGAHVRAHLAQWQVDDEMMQKRIDDLRLEWQDFLPLLHNPSLRRREHPVAYLLQQGATKSVDFQELLVAFLLELAGDRHDDLSEEMGAASLGWIDVHESIPCLKQTLLQSYDWALNIDFSKESESHYFWYVSEEKLEPRLGIRAQEAGAQRETPLDIARQIQHLFKDIEAYGEEKSLASFLRAHPIHRHIIKRVQQIKAHPYMEIQDNLIGEDCFPIDLLRLKLSFFGASKFDPRSDRWTRITLFQGAPCADELGHQENYNVWLPVIS